MTSNNLFPATGICPDCRLEKSLEGDTSLWIAHSRKTLGRDGAWRPCGICNRVRQEEEEDEVLSWDPVAESLPFYGQLQAVWELLLLDAGVALGGVWEEHDGDGVEEEEEEEEDDIGENWPEILAPIPQRLYRGPLFLDVYELGEGENSVFGDEVDDEYDIDYDDYDDYEDDVDNADDDWNECPDGFSESAAGQMLFEINDMLSSPWASTTLDFETGGSSWHLIYDDYAAGFS